MIRSRKHLAYIRSLPCCNCLAEHRSQAAHRRDGKDGYLGGKPSDKYAAPLCKTCHDEQHRVGERTFWGARDIDGLMDYLWEHTGDIAKGTIAVLKFAGRL